MKYFSMFSRIGGFEIGIQRAFNYEYAHIGEKPEQEECTQGGERSANKQELLLHAGDRLTPLCVGGFPCQAFSIAGKRGGFTDTRGTLFFEIARVLKDKRPRYFVLENVKGLLSHDGGKTFQTILRVLTETGYRVEWSVHNTKDYGIPQNRERIYIIGYFAGGCRPKVLPIRATNEVYIRTDEVKEEIHTGTLTARQFTSWNGNYIKQIVGGSQGNRVYDTSGVPATLASQSGGMGAKTGLYAVLTPDRPEKRQNGRRMKEDGEPSFTLTAQDKHGVYDGAKIRRLTPVECARLQGFPDDWCDGLSDTQQYKCYGNAVSVPVVAHIIKGLLGGQNGL